MDIRCISCEEKAKLACKCQEPRLAFCTSCFEKHKTRNPGSAHTSGQVKDGSCGICFETEAVSLCLCSDPAVPLCVSCQDSHFSHYQNYSHSTIDYHYAQAVKSFGVSNFRAEKQKVDEILGKLAESVQKMHEIENATISHYDRLQEILENTKQNNLNEIYKSKELAELWTKDLENYLLTGNSPSSVIANLLTSPNSPPELFVLDGNLSHKELEGLVEMKINISPSFINSSENFRPTTARPILNEAEKSNIQSKVSMYVENLAHCYFVLGSSACNRGDYSESQHAYESAILIWERLIQDKSESLGNCYEGLSNLHSKLQNLEIANNTCQQALNIKIDLFGPTSPKVCRTYLQLGHIEKQQGHIDKARLYYKKGLKARSDQSKDHLDNAKAYFYIGTLYLEQSAYAKAQKYLEKSLEIRESLLGKFHSEVGRSLLVLGNLYLEQGAYQRAEESYKRSLGIRTNNFGERHEEVASSYSGLANLMAKQAKLSEARAYYEKALEIREECLGSDHPDTASSYYSLGALLSETGDLVNAQNLMEKALSVRFQKLHEDHPDVARCYHTIGHIHRKVGKLREAKTYFEKAVKIRQKTLGMGHPAVASSYIGLANVMQAEGNLKEAKSLYKEALNIRLKKYGDNHAEVADVHVHLAILEKEEGNLAQAVNCLQEALSIRTRCYGPNHAKSINTKHLLDRMNSNIKNRNLVK